MPDTAIDQRSAKKYSSARFGIKDPVSIFVSPVPRRTEGTIVHHGSRLVLTARDAALRSGFLATTGCSGCSVFIRIASRVVTAVAKETAGGADSPFPFLKVSTTDASR